MSETPKENLYLFIGDEFLVKERVHKLIDEKLDPNLRDTNLTMLEGSGLDISQLVSELYTPSLFGGERVIVVNEAPIFMGKVEKGKTLKKVLDNWNSSNHEGALKFFAQLLSWAGIDKKSLTRSADWIEEITAPSDPSEMRNTLKAVGDAFVESGRVIRSSDEETFMEEVLRESFPKDALLIFTVEKADKRKKIFKAVQQRGHIVECEVRQERYGGNIDKSFFEERVRDALRRADKTITREGMQAVYGKTGVNMRRLAGELDKLIQYVGARKEITKRDVDKLFGDFYQAAFYELNASLRTGNVATCLKALHEHGKIADHPLQSLAMIANEFRKLMSARELLFTVFQPYWKPSMTYKAFQEVLKQVRERRPEITKKGKHPIFDMKDYPIYLYLRDAQKFPMDRLVYILKAVLDADILLKSSKISRTAPNIIMEQLALKICDTSNFS